MPLTLPNSPRTSAYTLVFAAYFAAKHALQFTTVQPTLQTIYLQSGVLFQAYEILITQPASVPTEVMGASSGPSSPSFPLNSPNRSVLVAAINQAQGAVAALNTAVQSISVADAQAAAVARGNKNSTFGIAFASGAFLEGYSLADAVTALAALKTQIATFVTQINEIVEVVTLNPGE